MGALLTKRVSIMLNVTINLSVIKKFEQVQKAPRADAVALLFGPGAYEGNRAAIDALLN